MKLDISVHKGSGNRPVVVLVHGLGMDKNIWIDPLNTKVFARNIPLKVFAARRPRAGTSVGLKKVSFGKIPGKIDNLWSTLKSEGFNIVCWSQRRPAGPVHFAVEELNEIIKRTKGIFPNRPIALVGHSRGGLIARKFMERTRPEIKALITISTPHAGSAIAKLGTYLKPFSAVLKGFLPKDTYGTISSITKNIADLLDGNAVKELLPDSDFFRHLEDFPQKDVRYISFGGTEPGLLTVYVRKRRGKKTYPEAMLSIPDSLLKMVPSSLIMDEITPGRGDGLVTAGSSLLPWSSKHYNLAVNHVSIIWDRKTIAGTSGVLKSI